MTISRNLSILAEGVSSSGVLAVTNGGTGVTTSTGTGSTVLSASPTLTGTLTVPTVTSPSATALTIQSAGTTAMTVDTSQNVGIGGSPLAKFSAAGSGLAGLFTSSATGTTVRSNSVFRIQSQATGRDVYMQFSDNVTNATEIGMISGAQYFCTGGSESMRIDTSGNLLVGSVGQILGSAKLNVTGIAATNFGPLAMVSPSASTKKWSTGPDQNGIYIIYNDAGTGQYMTYGSTSWTASSDERLKNIIEPISNGLAKVNTLRAVIGAYKNDEEQRRRPFVIAQDVQAVLPEAVDTSNPDKLGVAYTEIIPLLVAAIKELSAKNDALEARLAKLETV